MTVFEKIERCVSLVWDFQEIYDEEDIENFCHNELSTWPQHDEIMEYFKHLEELEKENAELKTQIEKMKLCQNCRFESYDDMEEPCRNCSRLLGDIKRKGTSDKWEIMND